MACPGGCVGGGGQPYGVTDKLRTLRARGLYNEDEGKILRCSHENPFIKKLYQDFLEKPLSEKAHHLLHTKYKKRQIYKK
jgi:NADH-quinone oxidoreductase subunit G